MFLLAFFFFLLLTCSFVHRVIPKALMPIEVSICVDSLRSKICSRMHMICRWG